MVVNPVGGEFTVMVADDRVALPLWTVESDGVYVPEILAVPVVAGVKCTRHVAVPVDPAARAQSV